MNRFITMSGAALLVALLTACTNDFYDSRTRGYIPDSGSEKFPISVAKGTVKLRVPVRNSRLAPNERTAVRRLAQQTSSLNSPVIVTRPPRSVKAEVLAAEITRELMDFGVARERIVHRANGRAGEVMISYQRKFAVTRDCMHWDKPLNETAMNLTHANFGCAVQFNLAAQVDNPEDFERPRVMTPPDSDARNRVIEKYRKGEEHTSMWPANYKVHIGETSKSAVSK